MTNDQTPDARGLLQRCQADPIFFGRHVLGGEQPWDRQKEIMLSVRDNERTAVPSGFAVGKTWVAARIGLWFLFSFPRSLVITTAPTWRQVENVLWAEIRHQHLTSKILLGADILRTQIKIADNWFAIGISTDEPARFQGFHAAHVLLIFDEASGVSREVWDAAEGQMAGAHARWLAIGNPIAPAGPFYDACGSELWKTMPISCLDSPNVRSGKVLYPKLVTKQWVEQRKKEWGEENPLYQSRVLGQFPTASEHGLIPLAWIMTANDRPLPDIPAEPEERRIGVDVARSGADLTVFLLRDGSYVRDAESYAGLNTMESVGRLRLFAERHAVPWHQVYIDVIGIGAGVVDRLIEQGCGVEGVNFAESACNSNRYANMRAEAYWNLRESLKPDAENPLIIPVRFGKLCAELVGIEWTVTSAGKIIMEPKDKIKQRIGRSPNFADALSLTFAEKGVEPRIISLGDDDDGDDTDLMFGDRGWVELG